LLSDIYDNDFKIDINRNKIIFPLYDISEGYNIFEKNYEELFFSISKNIGSMYKLLHKEGYVRGIGNSWYGNEVIYDNGHLGICDLDATFSKNNIKNEKLFRKLCILDNLMAKTAFFDSLNMFENSMLSIVASTLIEGFEYGYKYEDYKKLEKNKIVKQIDLFQKRRKGIIIE
jgi:hypothetical protein